MSLKAIVVISGSSLLNAQRSLSDRLRQAPSVEEKQVLEMVERLREDFKENKRIEFGDLRDITHDLEGKFSGLTSFHALAKQRFSDPSDLDRQYVTLHGNFQIRLKTLLQNTKANVLILEGQSLFASGKAEPYDLFAPIQNLDMLASCRIYKFRLRTDTSNYVFDVKYGYQTSTPAGIKTNILQIIEQVFTRDVWGQHLTNRLDEFLTDEERAAYVPGITRAQAEAILTARENRDTSSYLITNTPPHAIPFRNTEWETEQMHGLGKSAAHPEMYLFQLWIRPTGYDMQGYIVVYGADGNWRNANFSAPTLAMLAGILSENTKSLVTSFLPAKIPRFLPESDEKERPSTVRWVGGARIVKNGDEFKFRYAPVLQPWPANSRGWDFKVWPEPGNTPQLVRYWPELKCWTPWIVDSKGDAKDEMPRDLMTWLPSPSLRGLLNRCPIGYRPSAIPPEVIRAVVMTQDEAIASLVSKEPHDFVTFIDRKTNYHSVAVCLDAQDVRVYRIHFTVNRGWQIQPSPLYLTFFPFYYDSPADLVKRYFYFLSRPKRIPIVGGASELREQTAGLINVDKWNEFCNRAAGFTNTLREYSLKRYGFPLQYVTVKLRSPNRIHVFCIESSKEKPVRHIIKREDGSIDGETFWPIETPDDLVQAVLSSRHLLNARPHIFPRTFEWKMDYLRKPNPLVKRFAEGKVEGALVINDVSETITWCEFRHFIDEELVLVTDYHVTPQHMKTIPQMYMMLNFLNTLSKRDGWSEDTTFVIDRVDEGQYGERLAKFGYVPGRLAPAWVVEKLYKTDQSKTLRLDSWFAKIPREEKKEEKKKEEEKKHDDDDGDEDVTMRDKSGKDEKEESLPAPDSRYEFALDMPKDPDPDFEF